MARHSIGDPEVRELIDELVPLLLQHGSVSALQRALTSVLDSDRHEGWIHANRLHTLLSDDPTRAVNSETLESVRLAVSRLADTVDATEVARRSIDLRATAIAASSGAAGRAHDSAGFVHRVASEVDAPPAVVRWLLRDVVGPATAPAALVDSQARRGAVSTPDWSFQERAYDASLRSLRRGPNRKVGLVLPTGAGKTRVAMRIALSMLSDTGRDDAVVLWVTHRTRLKTQARRELQRAINEGTPELPDNAVMLLSERVHTTLLGDLSARLNEFDGRIALVVVDEAHHAAASSYAPILERRPLRGLFLTATPNRTDALPIGIDEIAYTITYRELFDLGVLIEPTFERPLTIGNLDWSDDGNRRDFADYVLTRAEEDFVKTLVVASRVDLVNAFYETLLEELEDRPGHLLRPEDIGYVHGGTSSVGISPDEFLDEFARLPRGIIVATSQLLGEGFDDPSINAVVLTYPTGSMVQLMQAAGRCLRYAPNKQDAYVVQVRESALAYHFEQRWLYQDIDDSLRPQLEDLPYVSHRDLIDQTELLLSQHRIDETVAARIRHELGQLMPGDSCSLLLTGLPYFGSADTFDEDAKWSAFLVTPENRLLFLRVFNEFSSRGTDVNDVGDFLRNYLAEDPAPASTWKRLKDMLLAMRYARYELTGEPYAGSTNRRHRAHIGTSWLTYVTFTYRAELPDDLTRFLSDAVNREAVSASFVDDPARWESAVKIKLPLAGTWAYLLNETQTRWLAEQRAELTKSLRQVSPIDSFAVLARWRLQLGSVPLPQMLVERFETFLSPSSFSEYVCPLVSQEVED